MNLKNVSATKMDADKRKPSTLTSAVKSTILLFLILFPLSFLHLIVHEGGHALVNLIYRIPNTSIYVHPFSFSGYSRPIFDMNNVWVHISGPIVGVLLPLAVFIPLWKHRSVANLFLVMLFPWNVFWEGLNGSAIFIQNGDFFNIAQVTTLPVSYLMIISIILLIIGIFLTVSMFPLLGLKPENRNTLWVLPVGMLLWALSGFGIAHWIVPGSTIDMQYHLAPEIIQIATFWLPMMVVIGIVLALIYVTLYRGFYRKLPASLRTETKELLWRDFRWPAVWFVVSAVIGLFLIR